MLSFLSNKTTTSNESFSWFKTAKNTITSFTTAGNHKVGFEDILYVLESGQRAFTPSHSGLRPPNTTKFIDDLRSEDRRSSTFWSEDRRSSTFWSSEDFGTTKNKTSYRRQKEDAIFILINTLPITSQHCLIPKTIPCHMEEKIINDILNDVNVQPCQYYIVLYGKHSTDDAVDKKYRQLIQLGFTNVFIYYGGLFEWMLLRDIYGEDKFPLHISDNKKDTYGCGNAYSEGRRRSPEEYGCGNAYSEGRRRSPEEYDVLYMRPPSKFSQIGNVT